MLTKLGASLIGIVKSLMFGDKFSGGTGSYQGNSEEGVWLEEPQGDVPSGANDGRKLDTTDLHRDVNQMPFPMLGPDLPPPPLLKEVMEKNIIPQVSLCTQLYLVQVIVNFLIW